MDTEPLLIVCRVSRSDDEEEKNLIKCEDTDEDVPDYGSIRRNPNFQNPDDGLQVIGTMSAEEIRQEKLSIWKNVSVISLSWMFLFTAYNAVANLQSSINSYGGLGTITLASGNVALLVSCLFVPTWMIKKLECKWTIVVCQLSFSFFVLAQFYPAFYTLIPASVIVGFGAAPMWSAKCTYLTQVGNRYAALIGDSSAESCISRFFGFFFMAFQSSQVWGNLISSVVLTTGTVNGTVITNESLNYCGVNFCNEINEINLTDVVDQVLHLHDPTSSLDHPSKIEVLTGILLGIGLLGTLIVIIMVDPLTKFGESTRHGSATGKSGCGLLVATVQQMKNPYQVLLIPLTLWSGFEQAFLTADFTEAFIACSWGVEHIGYVLICYGAADALGSITGGSIVKKVGRVTLFLFAAALNLALIIILLFFWRPSPTEPIYFFIIAGLWGLADSVWQTQIISFYGMVFSANEEAAFSNFLLWEAMGFTVAFAYSTVLCANAKLYVLIGMLGTGMVGYLAVELKECKRRKANINRKNGTA